MSYADLCNPAGRCNKRGLPAGSPACAKLILPGHVELADYERSVRVSLPENGVYRGQDDDDAQRSDRETGSEVESLTADAVSPAAAGAGELNPPTIKQQKAPLYQRSPFVFCCFFTATSG